jgi:hypothetical protein
LRVFDKEGLSLSSESSQRSSIAFLDFAYVEAGAGGEASEPRKGLR